MKISIDFVLSARITPFGMYTLPPLPKISIEVRSTNGDVLVGASVVQGGAVLSGEAIEIGRGVLIEAGAHVYGPAIIGDRTEVRHSAYLRGDTILGEECVIGHGTQVEMSVLVGGTVLEGFAFVGHSILGRVNLGAGTKLADVRVIPGDVTVRLYGVKVDTGLYKMGAVLGDGVAMGCNCVTMPGTVLGRSVAVYPNVTVSGYHAHSSIIKSSVIRADVGVSRGS